MQMPTHTSTLPAAPKSEFQVLLHLEPVERPSDDELAAFAEFALNALIAEAAGLALGPVASVDLDKRLVQFELTVEAVSASEVHQKIGLILAALERGTDGVIVDSSTSRSRAADDTREHELVCA